MKEKKGKATPGALTVGVGKVDTRDSPKSMLNSVRMDVPKVVNSIREAPNFQVAMQANVLMRIVIMIKACHRSSMLFLSVDVKRANRGWTPMHCGVTTPWRNKYVSTFVCAYVHVARVNKRVLMRVQQQRVVTSMTCTSENRLMHSAT